MAELTIKLTLTLTLTLVFGSQGYVHKNVNKRLQLDGLQKKKKSKKTCKIVFSVSHYRQYANMEMKMFCLPLSAGSCTGGCPGG